MNLEFIAGAQLASDLKIYANGVISFKSEFISKYKLSDKLIKLAVDRDEKIKNSVYLYTIDPLKPEYGLTNIRKKKGGSYQACNSALAKILNIKKPLGFSFAGQINNGGRGFLKLVAIREEE